MNKNVESNYTLEQLPSFLTISKNQLGNNEIPFQSIKNKINFENFNKLNNQFLNQPI